VQVTQLGENENGAEWDEYVVPRAGAITDVYAWRTILREAYGIKSHFLVAKEDSRIVGALGLFEIKHPVFGHYLTTAAFGNDGGFFFDDSTSRDALIAEGKSLAEKTDAQYLLIRARELELDGFLVDHHYASAVIDLSQGSEALWKRLPAKTRNQVRKGQKENFTVESGRNQLDAFFDVFHHHMRDLGSPAHGKKYYETISRILGDQADFLVVRDGDTVVAGALLCFVNETAMNLHTVSLRAFNRRNPNYLLYWTMMEKSAALGMKWFDMGRSRVGSPQLAFKSNWNPREVPLTYNYFLRKLDAIPDLDPRNAKFRMQIALWRKMPLVVTKAVGPRLITGLA
jgi:FemAB-related protein (PEP-CTERM system-associated)